jgi:hypothetical protein
MLDVDYSIELSQVQPKVTSRLMLQRLRSSGPSALRQYRKSGCGTSQCCKTSAASPGAAGVLPCFMRLKQQPAHRSGTAARRTAPPAAPPPHTSPDPAPAPRRTPAAGQSGAQCVLQRVVESARGGRVTTVACHRCPSAQQPSRAMCPWDETSCRTPPCAASQSHPELCTTWHQARRVGCALARNGGQGFRGRAPPHLGEDGRVGRHLLHRRPYLVKVLCQRQLRLSESHCPVNVQLASQEAMIVMHIIGTHHGPLAATRCQGPAV